MCFYVHVDNTQLFLSHIMCCVHVHSKTHVPFLSHIFVVCTCTYNNINTRAQNPHTHTHTHTHTHAHTHTHSFSYTKTHTPHTHTHIQKCISPQKNTREKQPAPKAPRREEDTKPLPANRKTEPIVDSESSALTFDKSCVTWKCVYALISYCYSCNAW